MPAHLVEQDEQGQLVSNIARDFLEFPDARPSHLLVISAQEDARLDCMAEVLQTVNKFVQAFGLAFEPADVPGVPSCKEEHEYEDQQEALRYYYGLYAVSAFVACKDGSSAFLYTDVAPAGRGVPNRTDNMSLIQPLNIRWDEDNQASPEKLAVLKAMWQSFFKP